jgi:hypothetical protein
MRRLVLFVLGLTAALVLVPTTAVADSATHTYVLVMDAPNLGVAANGDQIAITGEAEFSVNPKSVEGGGSFTHTNSSGSVLATGSWEATQLLDYQSYGCGIVHMPDGDVILPPNFCGGKVKMGVMLTTSLGEVPGTLTIFCIIGPNPPNSINGPLGEGATLNVPGIANFNHSAGGDNFIIQTG